MAPEIVLSISIIILLSIAGIFGFYMLRKLFFNLKWRKTNKEQKQVKEDAEAIKSGNMLDSRAFEKVTSKKDTFIDANTIQREKDINFAYQNINYRNRLLKDIYSGYKALDEYAGQKTISAMKTKNTSELYPTKPETDVDKKKIKGKHAKLYMQERNITYTYTPDMGLFEKIIWGITLALATVGLVWSMGAQEAIIGLTMVGVVAAITFVISIVLWGMRFMSFGVYINEKAKKRLSKAIFEDVKTIQWLDDILVGFLTRNPHYVPLLKETYEEESK